MSAFGIVVACHGELAKELIASAEMIIGSQEKIATVSLSPDENLETCQAAISAAIDSVDGGVSVMVLIDLFGGTPGNAAAMCRRERSFPLIAGVNLPMLLEVLLSREAAESAEELAETALKAGQDGIIDVGAKLGLPETIETKISKE